MGEVIAVPLTSERRAAVALAALRRLEAEYQVTPAADSIPRRIAGRARFGSRRFLRRVRQGPGAALVGGLVGLSIAVAFVCHPVTASRLGSVLGGPWGTALVLALAPALGVVLVLALRAAARTRAIRGAASDSGSAPGHVSWLVSYVTVEPDGSGSGRVRASVLRLTLPEGAEGQLRAILERAAATSAT